MVENVVGCYDPCVLSSVCLKDSNETPFHVLISIVSHLVIGLKESYSQTMFAMLVPEYNSLSDWLGCTTMNLTCKLNLFFVILKH